MEVENLELGPTDTTEVALGAAKAFPNLKSLRVRGYKGIIPKELASRVVALDCEVGTVPAVKYELCVFSALRDITIHNVSTDFDLSRMSDYFGFEGSQIRSLIIQGKRVMGEVNWIRNLGALQTLEVRTTWQVPDVHKLCKIFRSAGNIPRATAWGFSLLRDITDIQITAPPQWSCWVEFPTPSGGTRFADFYNVRSIGHGQCHGHVDWTWFQLRMLRHACKNVGVLQRLEVSVSKDKRPDAYADATEIPDPLPPTSPRIMNLLLHKVCSTAPLLRELALYVMDPSSPHIRETLEAFKIVRDIQALTVTVFAPGPSDPGIGVVRELIKAILPDAAPVLKFSWSDGVDYFPMSALQ
jgi:hypothetical protein